MAEETAVVEVPLGEQTLKEYRENRNKAPEVKADDVEVVEEKEEETEDGEQPAKGRGGFQKKIDRLIKQVSAANEELVKERKAREELESKHKEPKKEAAASEDAEPQQNQGETDRDYLKRLTRWEVKQEIKAQADADAKHDAEQRVQKIRDNYNEQVVEAKSRIDDWEEVVSQGITIPSPVGHAIMRMTNGPDVAYHLGKHPEIAEQLVEMDELEAIGEIWKISRELSPIDLKAQSEKKEERQTRKPPTPIKPVGISGTQTSTKPIDKMTTAEYRKARGFKPLPHAGRMN